MANKIRSFNKIKTLLCLSSIEQTAKLLGIPIGTAKKIDSQKSSSSIALTAISCRLAEALELMNNEQKKNYVDNLRTTRQSP